MNDHEPETPRYRVVEIAQSSFEAKATRALRMRDAAEENPPFAFEFRGKSLVVESTTTFLDLIVQLYPASLANCVDIGSEIIITVTDTQLHNALDDCLSAADILVGNYGKPVKFVVLGRKYTVQAAAQEDATGWMRNRLAKHADDLAPGSSAIG